ncbi:MAG: SurA N-terminal domain-containing protein [Desulfamplus sp.]|nr:SurA N-terminal domain-containing protein [Desulfamplus sp.]MBF0412417.1 SurA N-terminal domain-containing protein [Desulfamplus sp.]
MNIALSAIAIYLTASAAIIIITAKPLCAEVSNIKLIDRIIAIVNNDVITLVELNTALQPYIQKLESSGYETAKKQEIMRQLTGDMINRMVERKLTDQEAKRVKITVSDKEVDAAIERLKESQLMSQEELEKALKDDGLTFEDYREKLREEILRPKLINQSIKSKVVITESDIKEHYERNSQNFSGKKRYYLRNILIKSEGKSKEPAAGITEDKLQKKAKQIKQRLEGGEDFKTVATAESEAPNAAEGGDLGFFDWEILSDTIRDAVEPLKAGEYTNVISTDQGYQIFYVEKIDNQNLPPLNEVSESISKKLYDDIVEKKFREWLDALKEKSHIKIML